MATKKETTTATFDPLNLQQVVTNFCIIGTQPLIMNSLSAKAKRELLQPTPRKRKADREGKPKHFPLDEFRDSIHAFPSLAAIKDGLPTLCYMPTPTIKNAIATSALEYPNVTKAAIGRMVQVQGERFPVWGIPKAFTTVVRSADMNKTPDIRTRAIFPEWAAAFTVVHFKPIISDNRIVADLVALAGMINGIGDFRPEKGKGNYGSFQIVSEHDPAFVELQKITAQQQYDAIQKPDFHDEDSEELYNWWAEKTDDGSRGVEPVAKDPAAKKTNGSAKPEATV